MLSLLSMKPRSSGGWAIWHLLLGTSLIPNFLLLIYIIQFGVVTILEPFLQAKRSFAINPPYAQRRGEQKRVEEAIMNVHLSSTNETEAARRAFLAQIEVLLPTTDIAWTSIEYQPIRPFGSVGLVVIAPQMPGEAHVIAISLYNKRAIDYAHFPGSGEPYYQLLINNASGSF